MFWGTSVVISIVAGLTHIPTSTVQKFLSSCLEFSVTSFLNWSHSNFDKVESQCSFHFLDDQECWTYISCQFVLQFFRNWPLTSLACLLVGLGCLVFFFFFWCWICWVLFLPFCRLPLHSVRCFFWYTRAFRFWTWLLLAPLPEKPVSRCVFSLTISEFRVLHSCLLIRYIWIFVQVVNETEISSVSIFIYGYPVSPMPLVEETVIPSMRVFVMCVQN